MENASSFGGKLQRGFDGFADYLPSLVFGLILLGIGWVLAMLVYRGVTRLSYRLGFDQFLARRGLVTAERRSRDGSRTLGGIGGGLVFLLFAMQAFRVMRLYAFAAGIQRFFNYLPHIVAAAFIIGIALLIGDWVRNRLRASEAGANIFGASAVRAGILTLGAFMALQELGIGERIVTLAFGIIFGAIALAAALAFGLGSRSVAEQMSRRWYENNVARTSTFIEPSDNRTPIHAPRPDTTRTEMIDPAKRSDDEVLH